MQTTLLGIAIAIILALVAALVGPHFVDWSQYRAQFEAHASAVTGLNVRVAGTIDARLLPTPTLILQKVEVSRPGQAATLRARSLGVEFSLGALVRGEWRATNARLDGADIAVSLDSSGRLDWPVPSIAVAPDTVSIERLDIVDSRAVLADAASGSRVVLDKLGFRGELRSFAGPIKGEGAFVASGQQYPYRISVGRPGDDGGVRVRLNLDPIDRPLIADVDAFVFVEHGMPRFEGNLQLARPVGRAPDGIIEPWRITSRIRGDTAGAVLEQIEYQYGPEDRGIKLRGDANLAFGRAPQLVVGLSAVQVDLDRALGLPEAVRRRPLAAAKMLVDQFAGTQRPPIPVKLGVSIENVMLAGTMLQRVNGELKLDPNAQARGSRDAGSQDMGSWDVELLEFRAPGSTQVRLSGRLDIGAKGLAFVGPAKVDARDTRALVAWLADRSDAQAFPAGPLRVEGEARLGSDTVAIDRLKADLDRITVDGRFAYSWANGEQPARIEASLNAPDIDLDRIQMLTQGIFGDTAFEWPREGALSLKVGRASLGGVEVKRADVAMRFDRQGLEIERFALGDLSGATVAANGRIDTRTSSPRGTLVLDLDARALDGIAALIERFAPARAEDLRRRAARFVPAKVRGTLVVNADPARPAGSSAVAAIRLEGSAGAFRVNLQGSTDRFGEAGDASALESLSHLGSSKVSLGGRLEAMDGSAIVELFGLDSLVAVDKRPGRLDLTAIGPFDGEIAVDSQLVAGGLDVSTKGTMRLSGSEGPAAGLAVKVASANLRNPRPAAGRAGDTLPATLSAQLALAKGALTLSNVAGNVAGSDIGGRLKIDFSQSLALDGDIELGEINLPAAIAAAVGMPTQASNATTIWPADPFERGLLGQVSGRVTVRSAHVSLTPRLAAKNVRAVLQFGPMELALNEIDGTLAGGRIAGDLAFRRGDDGVTTQAHLKFAGADLAELIRGGPPPLSGRLTLDVDLEGTGRSAVAVIGSLHGGGSFTVQEGRILRLDPAAFEAVIRSVDQGLPVDAIRIRDRMEQAMANGSLAIPLAEGEVAVAAGQARLGNIMVRSQDAELALGGAVALVDDTIDAKLTLAGPERADAPAGQRPEVGITLKGPVDAPRRTLDAASFANWLALRAVEQQTKRIDALEASHEVPTGTPGARTTTPPTPPNATPPNATPVAPANGPARTNRTLPDGTTAARPRTTAPAQPVTPAPSARPPMDIRPPAAARQPAPPAASSDSWLERLIRP